MISLSSAKIKDVKPQFIHPSSGRKIKPPPWLSQHERQ
jgi:hypothetical protein